MNREISLYGLVLVGSGISEILAEQLTNSPTSMTLVQYVGGGIIVVGALIFLTGLVRKQTPSEKPLGITLLAISYGALGFLSVLLGGYIFTPLFLVALVSFLLSYGLLAKKSWALVGVQLLMVIGIFILFFLIGIGYFGGVAGILSASYIIWYANREHVVEYFETEAIMPKLSRRSLAMVLAISLLFLLPIGYLHFYPPLWAVPEGSSGGSGGGHGGTLYTFSQGDAVSFKFQVASGFPPVTVTLEEYGVYPYVGLASATGMSGSLIATIPSTGSYVFSCESLEGYYSIAYEIVVTQNSIRRFTPQLALLDVYLIIAVLSALLLSKPQNSSFQISSK